MIFNLPLEKIPVKTLYLLYGYDPWLLLDSLSKIKVNYPTAKQYCFSSFIQFSNFLQQSSNEIFNLDLFAIDEINKVLEIHLGEGKLSKLQLTELDHFLTKLTTVKNLVVIFIASQLSKTLEKNKWFQHINHYGAILVSKNLTALRFREWVITQFKIANLDLEVAALNQFISTYEHNLLLAKQSIDKLKIVFADRIIDLEGLLTHIEHMDLEGAKYSLFDLSRTLTITEPAKTIKVLKNLQQQSNEPVLVLWHIVQVLTGFLGQINSEVRLIKISKMLQQAGFIDLAIKQIGSYEQDLYNRVNKDFLSFNYSSIKAEFRNTQEYIWGLIRDLCLEISNFSYAK